MLTTLLLAAALDMPPMPPGYTPKTVALSPKAAELKSSLGAPMAKLAAPVPMLVPTGFVITNITVQNGMVSIAWQMGQAPFQIQGRTALDAPWNTLGNSLVGWSKTFPAAQNHYWRVKGNIVLPLNLNPTNQPRLTWQPPDIMSDSLQQYTLQQRATQPPAGQAISDDTGWSPSATTPNPAANATSASDSTVPNPTVWYRLKQTTVNGVVVPFTIPSLSNIQSGTPVLQRQFGGTSQSGYLSMNACTVDSAGNLIIVAALKAAGQVSALRKVDFGNGVLYEVNVDPGNPYAHYDDAVVVKYSSDGICLWAKQFGGIYEDAAVGVAVDSSDNVVVTGYIKGQPLHPIVADVGFGAEQTYGDPDVILVKYSAANGTVLWHKIFPGTTECSEIGAAVVVDKANNDEIVIAGTHGGGGGVNLGGGVLPVYGGTKDVFVGRLDKDGNHIWSKSWGGPGDDFVYRLALDSSGNVIAVGKFITPLAGQTANFGGGAISTTGGSADGWAAMYRKSDGTAIWVKQFGGDRDQAAKAVTLDASDNVYIAGEYLGTLDLGGGVVLPDWGASQGLPGPGNMFIAKYSNAGGYLRSRSFGLGFGSANAPQVIDLGVTASGNLILGGLLGDGIDFGIIYMLNSGSAALLMKFDTDIAAPLKWVHKSGWTDGAHGYLSAETPRAMVIDRAHGDMIYFCAEGAPNTNPSWPNGSFFLNTVSFVRTLTNSCVNNENWWKFQP